MTEGETMIVAIEALGPLTDKPIYCAQCGALCRQSWKLDSADYDKPGYGYDSRDRDRKKRYCYQCCAVRDARDMQETGRAILYLTERRITKDFGRTVFENHVTNWPGSLDFRVTAKSVSRHNITRLRYDVWFEAFGDQWHGVTYGDNTQICHVKRIKSPKMYDVTATAYELWGNAKDGFDTNNFYKRFHVRLPESSLNRTLLMLVKDHFQGFSFAWSENCSRPMVRAGITLDTNSPYMNEEITDIFYRGHVIGQLEIKPVR